MRHFTLAALSVFATVVSGTVAGAEASAPAGGHAAPPLGMRYATVSQVCPAPKPGDASCLALALVSARPGAAGASAYQLAAGALSTGPAGGLTPADLASAYGYQPSAGGTGQTVAIVDAYDDPGIEEDLAHFDSQYGLAACTMANGCFKKVGQTGSTTSLPAADTKGWSVEMASTSRPCTASARTARSCSSRRIRRVRGDRRPRRENRLPLPGRCDQRVRHEQGSREELQDALEPDMRARAGDLIGGPVRYTQHVGVALSRREGHLEGSAPSYE
jgi:hypothetical protein